MTHVKNVQAFGKLTGICTGYGGAYNPGQQNLQVNAMATLMTKAQQAMDKVNEAQSLYDLATNERFKAFKGLRHLASGVCALLQASGADPLHVSDARASCRKIWGSRKATRKANAEATAEGKPKPAFGYPHDFASIVNYFAALVETIANEPKYQPNEESMTRKGLQKRLATLQRLNQGVTQAEIRLTQAKRDRNELYYHQADDNLFTTALSAKLYIRGIFGYRSVQHMEVARLRFTKPRL